LALITEAMRGEAVEQAITPITQAVPSKIAIQRIPAPSSSHFHRRDRLFFPGKEWKESHPSKSERHVIERE